MKFYCDKCQTKYSIADEKVRGKVLKVRCKKCAHVITVREPTAPVKAEAPASVKASVPSAPVPAALVQVQWFYSVNGETIGPYALRALQQMIARGEVGDAVYVWNETFTQWKPVYEVLEFRASLERANKLRPRAQTLGISQALEAIKIEDTKEPVSADTGASLEEAGPTEQSVHEPARSSEETQKPLPGLFAKSRPSRPGSELRDSQEAPQEDRGRVERLARLRERLRTHDSGESEDVSVSVRPAAAKPAPQQAEDTDLDLALSETVSAVEPPQQEVSLASDRSADMSQEVAALTAPSAHDGLFGGGDDAPTPVEDVSSEDDDAREDGEKVPFFPAPVLESKSAPTVKSRSEQISGSLLIQLDSIQKEGRTKTLVIAAGVVLLIGGLAGAAIFAGGNKPATEPEEEAPKIIAGVEAREPVFHTYKREDQDRIRNLVELEDEVITLEEGKALAEEESQHKSGKASRVAPRREPEEGRRAASVVAPVDDFEAAMNGATAAAAPSAGISRTSPPGGAVRIEADRRDLAASKSGALSDDDRFNAMASAQAGVGSAPIYRPGEDLERRQQASGATSIGLSAEQAQQGFQSVRRSIGLCRERHMRRGGTIDVRKIYVSVEVQPTGRVASFSVEPESVSDTEFDRCMQSHMGRWNFSAFRGESVTIRAPFVLQ